MGGEDVPGGPFTFAAQLTLESVQHSLGKARRHGSVQKEQEGQLRRGGVPAMRGSCPRERDKVQGGEAMGQAGMLFAKSGAVLSQDEGQRRSG